MIYKKYEKLIENKKELQNELNETKEKLLSEIESL